MKNSSLALQNSINNFGHSHSLSVPQFLPLSSEGQGEITFEMILERALHFSKGLRGLCHPAGLRAYGSQPSSNFWPGLDGWHSGHPELPGGPTPVLSPVAKPIGDPLRRNIPLPGNPPLTLVISISSPSMWAKEENITL